MRLLLYVVLFYMVCSCNQSVDQKQAEDQKQIKDEKQEVSEKQTRNFIIKKNNEFYIPKNKIELWLKAESENEKEVQVKEFIKHKHLLYEQEVDTTLSGMFIPLLEIEKFYDNSHYLAILIGNDNSSDVTFLVLKSEDDNYKVLLKEEYYTHYRSPKMELLKDNFLSLEYEIRGGTDLLEQEIIVYYFDTDEQNIVNVLNIPNSRNTGSYLKYEITPSVEYGGANLKVQMDYKLRFCDPLMGDSTYSFETVKESYDKFRFWNCIDDESIVLLDDSKQFRFEWIPTQKQFVLKKGNESIWELFEQFTSTNNSFCEMYQTFEEDIKEYNPENALAVERLIKLCELEDE